MTSSCLLRRCASAERTVSATLLYYVFNLASRLKVKFEEEGVGACGSESLAGSGFGISVGDGLKDRM